MYHTGMPISIGHGRYAIKIIPAAGWQPNPMSYWLFNQGAEKPLNLSYVSAKLSKRYIIGIAIVV